MAASMTFMEEMKDKASRIIPSAYSEIVEETTSDMLLTPNYQNIIFICDSANSNPENITDIVRAVRRRIEHKSAKVQFFTIQLLDGLFKNCALNMHAEIAETKGLLHDLYQIATRKASKDGDKEAIGAALTLILNLSLWFSNHSDEKVKILAELADEVRKQVGPNAFEGIEPDTAVQIRRTATVPPAVRREQMAARRQRRQEEEYMRLQQEAALAPRRPMIVDAIPLVIPTEEEVSGMLDACLLLAECLNAAEAQGTPIVGDDVIAGVATQIRRDHRGLSMILSSGAEIPNMDVLFSVTDSQTSIIQRLAECVKRERRFEAEAYAASTNAAASTSAPVSSSSTAATSAPVSVTAPVPRPGTEAPAVSSSSSASDKQPKLDTDGRKTAYHVRQAEDVEDYVEMQDTPTVPPTSAPIPTMDDLFGGGAPAPAPAPATSSTAFPPPSQSVDHSTAVPQTMTHSEEVPAVNVQQGASVNDDGDDFDNFLSSRLRK